MTTSSAGKVLVVDDEVELMNVLVEELDVEGYEASGFAGGEDALSALREQSFDVLVTDLMMPDMDGLALLRAGLVIDPQLICIMMTGQGTIQTAVDAMKVGAFDYVLKPFRMQTLVPLLTRAMAARHMRLENLQLRETIAIYEFSQTIAFTLDPQTVINKLADAALHQTDADEVSVLLPTSDGQELYVAAVRGENRQRLLGERVPLNESISGWVAGERVPLVLDGEVNDERFRALWPHPEIRSAISVPMEVANKLVGIINLNALNRARPFTLGQVKALTILANTAAAALESASLYTQVRLAEKNYRSIFENAVEGIFRTTTDGRFIAANPAMAQLLGYDSPEELMASVTDAKREVYADPSRREKFERRLQKSDRVSGVEQTYRRKEGGLVEVSESARAVRDERGTLIYYEGIAEDITERKRAEEKLLHSEERYRLLFEQNPQPMWVYDSKTLSFLEVNDAAIRHYGYSRQEFLAMTIKDIRPPEDIPRLLANLSGVNPEHEEAGVWKHMKKDGTVIDAEITAHELSFYSQPAQIVLAYDVSERRSLEEQLRQSQKLEAIGMLAGGIAHDFNNLLTVIGGYSDLTLLKMRDEDPLHRNISEVKKAADRAAGLTRQLLAFSRKQVLQPKVLDLNAVVSDLEKMLRRLIGEDIGLRTVLDSELGSIKADPGQIEQIIMNLAVNARDAMPQGGKLTIETKNISLDEDYAKNHIAVISGPYVMLAVSDTGMGMDQPTQARIFEPFFTTKEAGKGTGLGLSTVYGIVKQSGGNIWVYSELGQGTSFKIHLPRVDEGAEEHKRSAKSEETIEGAETLLLAEDEEMVRKFGSPGVGDVRLSGAGGGQWPHGALDL